MTKTEQSHRFLLLASSAVLLEWICLGILSGAESGLEGYGTALFTVAGLLLAIPLALVCLLVALAKRERSGWAYLLILVLMALPLYPVLSP